VLIYFQCGNGFNSDLLSVRTDEKPNGKNRFWASMLHDLLTENFPTCYHSKKIGQALFNIDFSGEARVSKMYVIRYKRDYERYKSKNGPTVIKLGTIHLLKESFLTSYRQE
jgi:hypothetical protein